MNWFLLLPLWAAFNALAYLLAPILPLFASDQLGMSDNNHYRRVEPRLPWCLGWFMTPDNSLLGDAAFLTINGSSYWSMVKWLWRNPAAGLDAGILAATIKPTDRLRVLGNPQVSDGPHGCAGVCFVMLGWHWNLTAIIRWTTSTCTKLDFGWQLKTYAEQPSRIISQPLARYAFTIRPLIKFVLQQ